MVLWALCTTAAAATAGLLFLLDRERRRFLAGYRERMPARDVRRSRLPRPQPAKRPPSATGAGEAMVYIDEAGRCTAPNETARNLLRWKRGELMLEEVLAGGRAEVRLLLETLKREGVVAQHQTALADASRTPLEISGLALRGHEGKTWRAALFIRPSALSLQAARRLHSVQSRR